jgi:hypothetical protein
LLGLKANERQFCGSLSTQVWEWASRLNRNRRLAKDFEAANESTVT